jgi:hypothetical protein
MMRRKRPDEERRAHSGGVIFGTLNASMPLVAPNEVAITTPEC